VYDRNRVYTIVSCTANHLRIFGRLGLHSPGHQLGEIVTRASYGRICSVRKVDSRDKVELNNSTILRSNSIQLV